MEIRSVRYSPIITRIWQQSGQKLPNHEAWIPVIEADEHELIAARQSRVAVYAGYVMVRWAGFSPKDKNTYRVARNGFGDQPLPPAIQWLWVHPEQRGRQIGGQLMTAAEQRIIDRADVPNTAAVSVNFAKKDLLDMYQRQGYQIVPANAQEVTYADNIPVWSDEEQRWVGKDIRAVVMTKDLSAA